MNQTIVNVDYRGRLLQTLQRLDLFKSKTFEEMIHELFKPLSGYKISDINKSSVLFTLLEVIDK